MNVKQKFYENYCFVSTVSHNYLVSEHLLNKYSKSWGIVTGYYSLMIIGRLLCNIGSGDYPKEHGDFYKFLKGERNSFTGQKTKKSFKRAVLLQNLQKYDEDIEPCFRKLGNDLSKLVKVRTHSNYEQFVISHQFHHKNINPSLLPFISRLKDVTSEWLRFTLEFFLKYVHTLPIADKCFGMLLDRHVESSDGKIDYKYFNWGFEQFLKSHSRFGADEEKIQHIVNLWKEVLSPYTFHAIPVKYSFYDDITYDEYQGKQITIDSFITSLEDFR